MARESFSAVLKAWWTLLVADSMVPWRKRSQAPFSSSNMVSMKLLSFILAPLPYSRPKNR